MKRNTHLDIQNSFAIFIFLNTSEKYFFTYKKNEKINTKKRTHPFDF